MEIDSPPPPPYRHRILQRLAVKGIPVDELEPGLVAFVKNNKHMLADIILALFPTDIDFFSHGSEDHPNLKDVYRETMIWLKWLMFEDEPSIILSKLNVGQRGVCGAVWGKKDLAFRCKTCEHDPTCAICVPCFQNGDHKNHDYSIIYTGGGCCDCGDETAWKPEGFCSKHKGAQQIQPLPEEIASSVGPVLDVLLRYWREKLLVAEGVMRGDEMINDDEIDPKMIANEFSFVVVEMLLEFCNQSESLLNFISKRLIEIDDGLLSLLVRSERFLSVEATKKLHELLLKLLGDPTFKYEFAKTFIHYYPLVVAEVLRTSSDNVLKKYPLLSMFAVQIFTVPTLTPCLVQEHDLFAVLLECLGEILFSCCEEDGHFQYNKWIGVFDACYRVIDDIKFVLSHSVVAKYVTHERIDIVNVWLRILSLVQGMNAQKRETSIHIEEEHETTHLPFVVCHSIANIHILLVKGAFSDVEESDRERNNINDVYRHTKVGRLSEESSISSSVAHNNTSEYHDFAISPSILQLTFESTKSIDFWLLGSNIVSHVTSDISHSKLLAFKAALLKLKNKTSISSSSDTSVMINDYFPMDIDKSDKDVSISETERDSLALLSLSDWPDIDYDVSSQEISVHMPLHGLLSLIMKEALRHYYGEAIPSLNLSSSNHLKFFEKILAGCHPNGFSSFVMEHPLQSRVFCSQVRAGMWRKNGDAPIVCYDWYRSIRWSDHELDLFLLQLCAALAPANLYVKRILERFQLSNYLALDLKRSSEYEPVLMQELLTLIIQIVTERRFSGFTPAQSLQRELVCKLAIGDATHSRLVKCLPKDLSKLDQLQEILDTIAQYSNPSGMNQGKYSLRMPYWKELDVYHPCWIPRDLQVAEERYSRFCGVSPLSAQLPKWTNIYQPLIGISRIATCNTTIRVIRAVLFYAVFTDKSTESRAPDGVLITALHLLSLALDICSRESKSGNFNSLVGVAIEEIEVGWDGESGKQSLLSLMVLLMRMHKKETMEAGNFSISSLVEIMLKNIAELDAKCLTKLQQFAPEIVNCKNEGTENVSSSSDTEKRKMKARERQASILAKMRAEQSKFLATLKSSTEGSDDSGIGKEENISNVPQDSGETHVCCLCHDPNSRNPVSFLILMQKSKTVTLLNRGPPSWDHGRKSDELASSIPCTKIENLSSSQFVHLFEGAMSEFSTQAQPQELNAFIDYFKSRFPEIRKIKIPSKSAEKRVKTAYSLESLEQDMFTSTQNEFNSILDSDTMRDDENYDAFGSYHDVSLLLGKYVASLTKESKDSSQNILGVESAVQCSSEFGPSDCDGIHVSSCGHAVHQGCLDRYLSSLKDRLIRRMVFEGGHIVDPDQGEFLCPVCRRLANSTLPSILDDSQKLRIQSIESLSHSSSSPTTSNKEIGYLHLQYAISLLRTASNVASKENILKSMPMPRNERIKPNLEPVFKLLSGMYFSENHENLLKSGRVSPSVLMWDTLKYSLVSTEISARCGKNSLSARKGLRSLYDEFKSSGSFVLPLLLQIVQNTRSKNVADLLLRIRGLQLFSASICSGSVNDNCRRGSINGEGKIVYLLRYSNSEMVFPDIQFWDQASDPILIHDPFSTLMWILFCLPYPFLSSREYFMSLVHLFYGVSIIQAIFTYCSYTQFNANDLCLDDSLVSDIEKLSGKSAITKQIFISNYIDPSCHIKDVINNLTLPYLRRCLLLWKLLECSTTSSFSLRINDIEKSLDISESQDLGNFDGINELWSTFEIPTLDVVLKDKGLRFLTSKWYHHLVKEFEDQSSQRALHLTPVVPFQLMCLPVIYQDLMQRYIKVRCPSCEAIQDEPALCLLCGRLCSPAWKPCCNESGCQTHSATCGAGTGVFLLIRKTTILLQRNLRQAPWPSPYLDAFGEEDVEMRRGKPLYLNEERYAALTYMVASHGLDRSSKVLRQTTIGTFFMDL